MVARLHTQDVRVIDVGPLGTRVEHTEPLIAGSTLPLRFHWDGEDFAVDCTVVRSDLLNRGEQRYESGLAFVQTDGHAPPLLRRMLEALRAQEELDRLRTLVDASKLINSSLDPETLLASILTVAREELGVERGTLYFVDAERREIWAKITGSDVGEIRLPFGQGLAGSVAATGEAVILHDAYSDRRFDRTTDVRSGYRTRSMLCVPIYSREHQVVGVLQLLNKTTGSFGKLDLDFLASISDHMAIAMENARMHLEIVEKQRMERELQLGREIQSRLFPDAPTGISGVEISAISVPCFEVGGDYYDFLTLPDGDLGLVIGDVSGKGVSAALIMSSMQAALRVAAAIEQDLAHIVSRLNALLFQMTGGRKYVTLFVGRFSPATGELRYVNAGHNPPFVSDGSLLSRLGSTGRPIGILGGGTYTSETVTIPPGGTLFLYTDGLNEAENPDGEELGTERLAGIFSEASAMPPSDTTRDIIARITGFEQGVHATDDKTLVVLRRS
jgi:phosphoserine phosphatase RsbU/P